MLYKCTQTPLSLLIANNGATDVNFHPEEVREAWCQLLFSKNAPTVLYK